ncbi:MAG: small multi-drug export protein [Lachnospiraceae bacterium]|nr:small multi-drug export protein [Lachnospiraceae bacterium]
MGFTEKVAAKFATSLGKYIPAELVVVFVSMLPILELRAGLFVAKFLNLPLLKAIPLCIVGNIIPIPLILLFIKKIFKWLGKTKLFHKLVEKLEARAMKKSGKIASGEFIGLMLFVGIPIPGTGAWMGSLIAALLEIDFKKAILAELAGIAMATVIVSILSYGLLGIVI